MQIVVAPHRRCLCFDEPWPCSRSMVGRNFYVHECWWVHHCALHLKRIYLKVCMLQDTYRHEEIGRSLNLGDAWMRINGQLSPMEWTVPEGTIGTLDAGGALTCLCSNQEVSYTWFILIHFSHTWRVRVDHTYDCTHVDWLLEHACSEKCLLLADVNVLQTA